MTEPYEPNKPSMPVHKLTLAYDGTDFVGWQRQANGVSIQQIVEDAIQPIEGTPVTVIGAGRTDAGVHAIGQVASVRLASSIDDATLGRALNARLPPDVRVIDATRADDRFNARFDARSKLYRYRIQQGAVVLPFERRYVWHVPYALDVAAMRAAAVLLEGRHDFAAFQGAGSSTATTERTLFEVAVLKDHPAWPCPDAGPGVIALDCHGEGFLRHMVRNIVGTLVEVGSGRREPRDVTRVLASKDRGLAGPTAPASGLFLLAVRY